MPILHRRVTALPNALTTTRHAATGRGQLNSDGTWPLCATTRGHIFFAHTPPKTRLARRRVGEKSPMPCLRKSDTLETTAPMLNCDSKSRSVSNTLTIRLWRFDPVSVLFVRFALRANAEFRSCRSAVLFVSTCGSSTNTNVGRLPQGLVAHSPSRESPCRRRSQAL